MLNLDTHIFLHALTGDLTSKERRILAGDQWSISAIVLWEIVKLAQLGRITVDVNDAEFIQLLSRVHTWPITLDICKATRDLDFRSDPADELIAATSVFHGIPLVTRDGRIRKSRRVPLAG